MGLKRLGLLPFVLLAALPCCKSDGVPMGTMARIRALHLRILTVDGSVGGGAPEKILSRMAPGGLDAAVFVVPIRQGGSTAPDHAKARDAALEGIRRIRE